MRLSIAGRLALVAIAALLVLSEGGHAVARTVAVAPGGASLRDAIAVAEPGDVLSLSPGVYEGPVVVDRALTLEGGSGVVLDGMGHGRVLSVTAPDTVIRGLTVRNSGIDLAETDAGIFLDKTATGALIEDNRLENNLFGIYLHGAKNALVRGNEILGRQDLRMNERGNGIHLWNAEGSVIEGNRVRFGRDGIFVTTSKRNTFRGNHFRELRFAIHYMYNPQQRDQRQRFRRQPCRLRADVFGPSARVRQSLGGRPRPRLPLQLRQQVAHRGQYRARGRREMRVPVQCEPERTDRQSLRGLRHRGSISPRAPRAT